MTQNPVDVERIVQALEQAQIAWQNQAHLAIRGLWAEAAAQGGHADWLLKWAIGEIRARG